MSKYAYLRTALSVVALGGGVLLVGLPAAAGDRSAKNTVNPKVYQSFRSDVAAISSLRLDRPKNIEKARSLLVNYDEKALSRGAVAEFAAIAARSDSFVKGLKRAQKKYGGRKQFLATLQSSPHVVLDVRGWESAARDVAAAAARDTADMEALAFRFSEVAYGRTAQEAKLEGKGSGVTSATPPRRIKKASPLMVHVLAVGAMMQLEGVSDLSAKPALASFAADKSHDQCLRWARLNISQCLAAAGTKEETAYCLSTQALNERTKCWSGLASSG